MLTIQARFECSVSRAKPLERNLSLNQALYRLCFVTSADEYDFVGERTLHDLGRRDALDVSVVLIGSLSIFGFERLCKA